MASNHSKSSSTDSDHPSEPTPSPQPKIQRSVRIKSIPKRPARSKTIPSKLKEGIDKRIPGVPTTIQPSSPKKSKGIKIAEPQEASRSKKVDPQEAKKKGKEKVSEIPQRKKETTRRRSQAQASSQTPSKRQKTVSQGENSSPIPDDDGHSNIRMLDAITETSNFNQPPNDFDTKTATVPPTSLTLFKERYTPKEMCPVVSVDLAKLKDDLNCDVYPWLGQFESLLSITAPYSPSLVKLFYFNMDWDNIEDIEGNLIEQRVSTTVRDTKMIITANLINSILKIDNPPPPPEINYSNTRIFELLRPNEPVPNDQIHHLSFTPVSMPPLYRVVWYIYSRNLLQKGGSYTHFAKKDYPLFAAIIDRTPINIGEWLFQEMVKFKFSSRNVSHVPFGSLVSVILFYHRVWHLQSASEMRRPPTFGKTQLNLMRITFTEASGHSRARSFARASQARGEEATSAPTPSIPRTSGSLEERIRKIVKDAVDDLSDRIESEVGKLVSEVTKGYNELASEVDSKYSELLDAQTDMSATLGTLMVTSARIEEKLDSFLNSQPTRPGPSTGFGSPSGTPTASPSGPPVQPFTFTTPTPITTVPSTPDTEVIPPTHTPSTQVLPTPSTAIIIHPSFTPTSTFQLDSPTSSTETIPIIEDDKGGEE